MIDESERTALAAAGDDDGSWRTEDRALVEVEPGHFAAVGEHRHATARRPVTRGSS